MVYIKNNLGASEPDDLVTYNIALLKMILISLQKSGSLEEKKFSNRLHCSFQHTTCAACGAEGGLIREGGRLNVRPPLVLRKQLPDVLRMAGAPHRLMGAYFTLLEIFWKQ